MRGSCAVFRISFRGGGGGGGSKYFLKSGGICIARSHAFTRGVQGYAPPRQFFKMVRFGEYFAKILQKSCKNIHFYNKIIDNVLLRTLYLAVLEHTPQISCQLCNLVCFVAHFP